VEGGTPKPRPVLKARVSFQVPLKETRENGVDTSDKAEEE